MIRAVMLKSHATKELEALGGESPRKFYLIPRRNYYYYTTSITSILLLLLVYYYYYYDYN